MRSVTIRFINGDEKDSKFRLEVEWSPKSEDKVENEVAVAFHHVLDSLIKETLGPSGFGAGKSAEEARQKAFIERDIAIAGRTDSKEGEKQNEEV